MLLSIVCETREYIVYLCADDDRGYHLEVLRIADSTVVMATSSRCDVWSAERSGMDSFLSSKQL